AEVLGQHVILARAAAQDGICSPADLASPLALPAEAPGAPLAPARITVSTDSIREFHERLKAALPDERAELMNEYVRAAVMDVLRMDPGRPPEVQRRLMDLGLDSLMAIQLRNLLEKGLGLERVLPATLMFDYPTIAAISAFLLSCLGVAQGTAAASKSTGAAPPDHNQKRVQELDALSEEEAAALLLKRLERT
ncbi:MAG TPA: acyl carrier protein, partial [Verrucomicrobiae bacterium]|nr:acyl carrier protein [Verrucomicrobiae bacterium]